MSNPIILFDGVCNFCDRSVQFIIKRDPKAIFRFTPLQSQTGQALMKQYGFDAKDLSSMILIEEQKAYTKTTGALRIARRLQGPVRFLYVLIIIPSFIRNIAYHIIAKYRYSWFGKKDTCIIPDSNFRSRFID